MSKTTVWGSSIGSGIVGSIVSWILARFPDHNLVEHLRDFLFTFSPVWIGLAVWLIVWAFLSVLRITRTRDAEVQKWLEERNRFVSGEIAATSARLREQIDSRLGQAVRQVTSPAERIDESIRKINAQLVNHENEIRSLKRDGPALARPGLPLDES